MNTQIPQELVQILNSYQQQQKTATVRYAGMLTSEQKATIEQTIRDSFSEVEDITYTEDSNLLAGFSIEYQDYVYDASLKGKLQQKLHE